MQYKLFFRRKNFVPLANRYDFFLDDTGNVLMLRITKKFEAYTMLLYIYVFLYYVRYKCVGIDARHNFMKHE